MVYRLNEVIGQTTNDSFITDANGGEVFFGRNGDDVFTAAALSFVGDEDSIFVGGSGNDTYNFLADQSAAFVINSGGGSDILNMNGVSLSDGHTGAATVDDGRHLVVFGANPQQNLQGVVLLNWQDSDSVVETVNLRDGSYSWANFTSTVTSLPVTANGGFVGDIAWEDIEFSDGVNVADLKEAIDFYAARAHQLNPVGTAGNDVLSGSEFGDLIEGLGGNDVISGLDGNDRITGGDQDDTLNGGAGNDWIIATHADGNDSITGGSGFDILDYSAVNGVVQINQLAGTTTGSAGNDVLNDVIEQISGSNFNDVLSGGHGINVLDGNGGDDLFFGNKGDDLLRGGAGNDTFFFSVNDGNDRMQGGAGFDVLDYSSLSGVVQVNQLAGTTTGTANNDILLDVFEQVVGTDFNDVLSGGHGINSLNGGGGDDQIFANGGDDWTTGGTGNDTITLGPGNDRFQFWDGDGADTVTDFAAGADSDDQLVLSTVWEATSLAQMLGDDMISQAGPDTLIDFGGGDTITLLDVNMADLHVNDFIF